MASNLGFRVGLLLEQFFSDRRRKCYFFVNTDKINTVLELKETLTNKFNLPSEVQLMHNGFLLLDEDTVFVIRQDETIEVVPCSPKRKKSSCKDKTKNIFSESPLEPHCSLVNNGSILTENTSSQSKKFKELDAMQVNLDESSSSEKVKKKKKKKSHRSSENLPLLDSTVDDASGLEYHSSPFNFVEAHKKSHKTKKVESPSSSCNYDTYDNRPAFGNLSEIKSLTSERVNPPTATQSSINSDSCSALNIVDSSRSNKRKWKNEQNKLKYSGVAELIKQIQTGTSSRVEAVENTNPDIGDIGHQTKRKRTRRRKRKDKSNENSFISSEVAAPVAVDAFNGAFKDSQRKPRIHKRFDSNEDIGLKSEMHQDASAANGAADELNLHTKLCNQISPLTPPSEHNSEDDVYKKLLGLKKMNKPVVFERAMTGDVHITDNEEKHLSAFQGDGAVPPSSDNNSNVEQMEVAYQETEETALLSKAASTEPRNSSNSAKDEAFSGAENQKCQSDISKKETCPAHIKKNICDINLEKIDISNYPIIESTRKNDILVFKTLKLSACLSPTLSNLILARVLDIDPCFGTLTIFEILGGEEELDFTADGVKIEEYNGQNPLIKLNWTDLYEPRLLYP